MESDSKVISEEAEGALRECRPYVAEVAISGWLERSRTVAYLNLETKEARRYCVEITASGFRVVGDDYDTVRDEGGVEAQPYFETVNALLDNISSEYRRLFAAHLASRLGEVLDQEAEMAP